MSTTYKGRRRDYRQEYSGRRISQANGQVRKKLVMSKKVVIQIACSVGIALTLYLMKDSEFPIVKNVNEQLRVTLNQSVDFYQMGLSVETFFQRFMNNDDDEINTDEERKLENPQDDQGERSQDDAANTEETQMDLDNTTVPAGLQDNNEMVDL